MLGDYFCYLHRFSESRSSSGSTPDVRLSVAVRLSVRNTLGCQVSVICNSKSFHSFFIQTLSNDRSHIEDVHLLFCARFIIFFLIFEGC